jgi:hypothetical protein
VSTTAHRLCRYAPSSKAVVFGAHTDTSFFTLVPLSAPPGLEVFDPSLDAWVRPEAAEGAEATDVLCMPGEFLELASAGAFRAVVHRVLGGPTKRVSTPLLVRGDRRFGLGGVNAHDCWRALQESEPDRAAEAIRRAPAHVDGASYVAPHRTRAEAETFYSLALGRAAEVLSADPLVVLLPAFASDADCAAVLAAASKTAWLDDAAAPGDLALRAAAVAELPPAHAERWRVDTYGPGDEPRADAAGGRFATLLLYLDDGFAGGATAFPDLGLTVAPKRGDAIFVRDARTPLLRADRLAVAAHAAARREELPVEAGVKHVLTRGFRAAPFPDGAPSNDGD